MALAVLLTACGDGSRSYSLLPDGQNFQQATQNTKIDVLWIIDNSGSMATSQQNLANNFPSFINTFIDKKYNFKIAVGLTDAYLALPVWTPYYNQTPKPSYYEGLAQTLRARFRDGIGTTHSGFYVLTPATPNLHQNFMTNIMQGINGRGDERSLQSMRTVLESSHNAGFRRPDGFLAVILVTDEDDFSHDGTTAYETYSAPLHPVSDYVTFLDGLTGSSANTRRYSVSTISVNTQTCLNSIYNGAQKIGVRVGQLADLTQGVKGNLCGNFATELEAIADKIVQLSTQFYLGNKKPKPETIAVKVNGVTVPNVATNPLQDGGWVYILASNSIQFQGQAYTPPQGAAISVTFEPEELSFP